MAEAAAVYRLADAVQRRDADALAALFADAAVAYHPLSPNPLHGRQAIRANEQALFDAFSEIDVDIRTVLSGDGSCAAELVLRATNTGPLEAAGGDSVPATGRRIQLPSVWVLELGPDGLIVAERDYFDTAALMAQLGLEGL